MAGGGEVRRRCRSLPVLGHGKGERKDMIRKILVLVLMVLIFSVVPAFAGNSEKEKAAVVSAGKWLGMVDSEKYSESWKEAAELFRDAIKEEQWRQSYE